jgi:hypothetical protein
MMESAAALGQMSHLGTLLTQQQSLMSINPSMAPQRTGPDRAANELATALVNAHGGDISMSSINRHCLESQSGGVQAQRTGRTQQQGEFTISEHLNRSRASLQTHEVGPMQANLESRDHRV